MILLFLSSSWQHLSSTSWCFPSRSRKVFRKMLNRWLLYYVTTMTWNDVSVLTSELQEAFRRWSSQISSTPVQTLIRLLHVGDGVLFMSRYKTTSTVEEVSCHCVTIAEPATQSKITSFCHRKCRDLQDHSFFWVRETKVQPFRQEASGDSMQEVKWWRHRTEFMNVHHHRL